MQITHILQTLRKSAAAILTGTTLCLASVSANAVEIFFDPASQMVDLGDSVSVDVVITDLGDLTAPALTTFDVDVLFDDSLLSVTGVTFGTGLDTGSFGSIQSDFGFPGGHNVFEISLEDSADLIASQPSEFVLFTLTFDTLGVGTSPLTLNIQDLGDEQSNFVSADTRTGEIQIKQPSSAIPVPATFALMGFGLAALGYKRHRGKIAV